MNNRMAHSPATSPIFEAVCEGDEAAVRRVLDDDPAAVHTVSVSGEPRPLHTACIYGLLKVAELLIDRGADINDAENQYRQAALHVAANNGHTRIVALLLERGADASMRGYLGRTALMLAARGGKTAVVKLLLEHNHQDINLGDKDYSRGGKTALMLACKHGWHKEARLLLQAGADPLVEAPRQGIAFYFAFTFPCRNVLRVSHGVGVGAGGDSWCM